MPLTTAQHKAHPQTQQVRSGMAGTMGQDTGSLGPEQHRVDGGNLEGIGEAWNCLELEGSKQGS